MRALVVLLLAAAAAGGAWWLLRPGSDTPEEPGETPTGGTSRASPAQPVDAPAAPPPPRIGPTQGNEGRLVAEGEAGPWDLHRTTLARDAKGRLTGAALIRALSERFYVRARTQAELDELAKAEVEGAETDAPVPLSHVIAMLDRLGWQAAVMDPVVMLRRRPADPARPDPR